MGVGGQRHVPAALPTRKTRYPLCRWLGGPQSRSGRVWKISSPPPHRDSIPGPFSPKCVAIPTELSLPKQNLLPDIKFIFNSSTAYLMISMLWEKMLVRHVNSILLFWTVILTKIPVEVFKPFHDCGILDRVFYPTSSPPPAHILGAGRMIWSLFIVRTHDYVVICDHLS